jgi:hypothetical protein
MSTTFSVPLPPLSDVAAAISDDVSESDKNVHGRSHDESDAIDSTGDVRSEKSAKRGRKTKAVESESGDVGLVKSAFSSSSDPEEVESICRPSFTKKQIFEISRKFDFFMILNNCTPFKDLVDLIHPVLERISFNVIERMTKSGKIFRGITINSMDPNKIAMITARLRFDTIFPEILEADQDFCISSATFPEMIKSIEKGSSMEIKRVKSGNDVIIRGFNPNVKNNESIISFPTIDNSSDNKENYKFNTMDYKYSIDIELASLRALVRIAASQPISARNIEFKIFELLNTKSGEKINKLSISYDCGPNVVSLTRNFYSKTKWDKEQKQTVITSSDYSDEEEIEDETRMVLVLEEKFTTKYLHLFLKSMDRQIINILISNGKPLVIIYPLNGGEDIGRCNFILAPSNKEGSE